MVEISEKWICDYELVQKAITDDESWNMLYDISYIHKETHMRLWIAYYNLSLLHRTILDCKILGLTTNRQMLSRLKKIYGKKCCFNS
jgi:hypothetical protein